MTFTVLFTSPSMKHLLIKYILSQDPSSIPDVSKGWGTFPFLSLNRTSVWQQSLQGILRLVACLCPFNQGLVLWWKTRIASYHQSSTELWNFHCPAEIFCNDLPTMFCHCSSSQFRHRSFPLSRGAPEFVRLPAFSLVACTVGLPGSPPFHFIIFHA